MRIAALASAGLCLLLGACSAVSVPKLESQRLGRGEVPTMIGPAARDNRTPMEPALACFGDQLVARGGQRIVIAVGDIKDYTGKYSINEGNAITQGGALMVYSALGKIGPAVGIAERFDPTIAERELGYTDRRQLGDGNVYDVNGNKVPWMPYFGGTIAKSDYYVVGGITELNYNIRSSGAEAAYNNIGPKARIFTESVSVDLRIVNSRSLVVVKTISLTKQFHGYEVGANVFRFFGIDLFDINIGQKGQEPLQLGIRTALEEATMKLVGAVASLDPSICLQQKLDTIPDLAADQMRGRALVDGNFPAALATRDLAQPSGTASVGASSLNATTEAAGAGSGGQIQIGFEFGDATLMASAQAVLDRIATLAAAGPVDVVLVARDTESWDPAKRDALIEQRIGAVASALANRGLPVGGLTITWRPDKADTSIHRDGPGLQEIVKIQVKK